MSGTYGEPGKNPYPIPGIVGQYSNVVNASTGVSQIYQKSSQFQYTSIGTYNPSTKKFTPDPNANLSTRASISYFLHKLLILSWSACPLFQYHKVGS